MQARTLLLALLVATPVLAGCLTQTVDTVTPLDPAALVSQPLLEELIAEHLPFASFDGTEIDVWVFRPETDEPVPVIINFSPYWSNLSPPSADGGDAFSRYLIDYYVPRGYAVALVSARGTGLSEGCFVIGGPDEVRDIDLTATYLATQPWANGNVAATGKSYDGTMANALLTVNNEHVKTIVPVSPISEFYKYNLYGGIPYAINGHVFNTYYVLDVSISQNVPPLGGDPTAFDPTHPTYEKTPTRFCDESVDVQRAQYESLLTGVYTPYWQERNYSALLPAEITASVFYIHGLQDWNVKPDHMTPWIDELQNRGATVKMWLGQWEHDYPTRDDWNLTMLRWFDHTLKGIDTGIMDEPLVQVQDDAGTWRHETDWPTPRATTLTLWPDGDGTLADATPAPSEASYHDSPAGRTARLDGTLTRAPIYERTFDEATRIVGSPTLHALVSSTGPRATLTATLYVNDKVVDEGYLDLTLRESLQRNVPMTPGTTYQVTVPLYPQDILIPAGSTLRLELAHDGAGLANGMPWPTTSTVTIHHGDTTRLELPVLAADDVTPEPRQPQDIGCWAC